MQQDSYWVKSLSGWRQIVLR